MDTSHKQRRFPFNYNPELGRKFARLHRLHRKGLTPPSDKAVLRAMCDEAARTHTIRRVSRSATTTENSTSTSE